MPARSIAPSIVVASSALFGLSCESVVASDTPDIATVCRRYETDYANVVTCLGRTIPSTTQMADVATCTTTLDYAGAGPAASQLAACAEALETGWCTMPLPFACQVPRKGALGQGAWCSSDAQCASGACAATPHASLAAAENEPCGMCTAALASGSSCDPTNDSCGPGAVCVASTAVCTPIVPGGSGARCDDVSSFCQDALVCSSVSLSCVPRAGRGGGCGIADDCAAPLTCIAGACSDRLGAGAPCSTADECVQGMGCNGAKTCAARTGAAPDQPCDGAAICLFGACNSPTLGGVGTCPTVLTAGEACDPSDGSQTCGLDLSCVAGECSPPYTGCGSR